MYLGISSNYKEFYIDPEGGFHPLSRHFRGLNALETLSKAIDALGNINKQAASIRNMGYRSEPLRGTQRRIA